MYKLLIKNSDGTINYTQSIINILNSFEVASNSINNFSIIDHSDKKQFALTFSNQSAALNFHAAYPELGELNLDDPNHHAIILNQSTCFNYLFNKLASSEQLLSDPTVPPILRVNLFEGFMAEIIRPFIFHGARATDLQVDFEPIKFKKGKIHITLRGLGLGNHNNTQVEFDNFDKLAMVCMSSDQHAPYISAIKQLLFAYNIQEVLKSSNSSEQEIVEIAQSKVKISTLVPSQINGKLYLHLNNVDGPIFGSPHINDVKKFRQLLNQLIGDNFTVKSSTNEYGSSSLEIAAVNHTGFTNTDIEQLNQFFSQSKELVFLDRAYNGYADSLQKLRGFKTRERFTFDDCEPLQHIFCDMITLNVITDPVVVGSDGHTHSAAEIQKILDDRSQRNENPLTRAPITTIRENLLFKRLLEHYKTNGYAVKPALLEGLTHPAIVPNGETYDLDSLKKLFLEQNSIQENELLPSTQALLADGSAIRWDEIWPNRTITSILEYYQEPPNYNSDRNVIDHPDNPLLSLAATISCLLNSNNSLSKDDAAEAMITGKLPVQIIWSSEPHGLRLNFDNKNLAQDILRVLSFCGINAKYENLMHKHYDSLIFLSAESVEDIAAINTFIFEICNYSRAYTGFDRFFTTHSFRAESAPRVCVQPRRQAAPVCAEDDTPRAAANEASNQESVLRFLTAMFYGTIADVEQAYAAIPPDARQLYNQQSNANTASALARIPSAAHTPSASINPMGLMAQVLGSANSHGGGLGYGHHGMGPVGPAPLPLAHATPNGTVPPAFSIGMPALGLGAAAITPLSGITPAAAPVSTLDLTLSQQSGASTNPVLHLAPGARGGAGAQAATPLSTAQQVAMGTTPVMQNPLAPNSNNNPSA